MKYLFKLLLAMLIISASADLVSAKNQNSKEVTLIVTSDGETKDEAIKNALRNAIEQT